MQLSSLVGTLNTLAPLSFAEPWDNVGLLAGDLDQKVSKVLLTIDLTSAVVEEAMRLGCQMVIAYHPPIFDGLKRIDYKSPLGTALRHGIALYSPHTALDAAIGGTNDVLGDAIGLLSRSPIKPAKSNRVSVYDSTSLQDSASDSVGMGRIGPVAPLTRKALIQKVKDALHLSCLLVAGPMEGAVSQIAVAAGAGGDLLKIAVSQGVDAFICGELRHHDALFAAAAGVTVICTRHSSSERLALLPLGRRLSVKHPEVEFLVSKHDREPFDFM